MRTEIESSILALIKGDLSLSQAADVLVVSEAKVIAQRSLLLAEKLPTIDGEVHASINGTCEILRDRWGVAHIEANSVADGFHGLGYAMAQDRLWQLDYMRRLACGRLSEVLGSSNLPSDRFYRTIGLKQSSDEALAAAGDEVRMVLASLADGINAAIRTCKNLPLEFDLLDYAPEPWTPIDSIALWKWRWWMLTGRLNILVIAELAKRHLSEDLFQRFMTGEANEETIVPDDLPASSGGHDTGEGSNNWVVGGSRTGSGKPILATDPHNGIEMARQWYQAQLTVPGIDAIGAFYLGTPGIYLGHTRHTAWGVTNHTASALDVYREEVDDDHPDAYLNSGTWENFDESVESISVKDEENCRLVIRQTERGPLIQDFIPELNTGGEAALSLKWQGSEPTTGFESMLALLRSANGKDVLNALSEWPFPILNFVFADNAGRIGYHVAGHIPTRACAEPGLRQAGNPKDAWTGIYAFDEVPRLADPPRDWVASANNPPWGGDIPYLRLGAWSDGYRFRRIRQRIEGRRLHTLDSVGSIQTDVRFGRAQDLAPIVGKIASRSNDASVRELGEMLLNWDGSYHVDSTSATIFTVFWDRWLTTVARAQFSDDAVPLVKDQCGGVARQILEGNAIGWLPKSADIAQEVAHTIEQTHEWLLRMIGSESAEWRWGNLHTVTFVHPIATTPSLKEILEVGPVETSGVTGTVRAAGHSVADPFIVTSLSTYRMVVDMSDPAHGKATAAGGQSGHPASPHYCTQTELWLCDDYHPLLMDRTDIEANLEGRLVLKP